MLQKQKGHLGTNAPTSVKLANLMNLMNLVKPYEPCEPNKNSKPSESAENPTVKLGFPREAVLTSVHWF